MEFKTEVGIDTRAKNGGYGCSHPKVGGPLVAEGHAILHPPPQTVFGTFPFQDTLSMCVWSSSLPHANSHIISTQHINNLWILYF